MRSRWLPLFALIALLWPTIVHSQITPEEWATYKDRFVTADGRVIDDANGGISHSESQGYGLLLAWLADSRADFERIWSFTEANFLLRDDGLAVWKWDPAATPHVSDVNNASDGDMLVAYALALAGEGWRETRLVQRAADIARALAATSLYEHDGMRLIRPGVAGFSAKDRPDGPVVNLSYWVFEALPVMERLAPEADWAGLARSGKALISTASFGDRRLPPEWLSVKKKPAMAKGFPGEFGYNALRIPLYLIRAGDDDAALLTRLRDGMTGPNGGLAIVALDDGRLRDELMDPGYRIIGALAGCILDGKPLAADLTRFEPTLYYPSTLHLLALAHAREDHPKCL